MWPPCSWTARPGRIDADAVLSDSFGGARDAVAHLIAHGHRRIGFIGDHAAHPHRRRAAARLPRRDGGRRAAGGGRLGLARPHRPGAGARRRPRAMLDGPEPGHRDLRGQQPGHGHRRTGPRRARARPVALVGFDDFELADLLAPGVTVVAQDAAPLGRTAAERLFRRLDGAGDAPRRMVLPTRLITRGSGELPPAD